MLIRPVNFFSINRVDVALVKISLKLLKKLTHPVIVFIGLQIVWVSLLILWIFWFITQKELLFEVSKIVGNNSLLTGKSGLVSLIAGSILLGMLLVGTIVLFIFTQIQSSLITQQKSFVSSVTHELRSPLASLQLSFETMQRTSLPSDIREKLFKMVQSDIDRLITLVDRILISSRLDKGIIDLKSGIEYFKISDVIDKVISQNNHLDHEIARRVVISCPEDLALKTNRLAIHLVISNLLENAIKYSPAKSPIEILVEHLNAEILIKVRDFGCGLNKRDEKRIFYMFHRGQLATKRAVPGTGLGLFIARSMVKGLGGQIWAESSGPDKGSSFFVSLPISLKAATFPLVESRS